MDLICVIENPAPRQKKGYAGKYPSFLGAGKLSSLHRSHRVIFSSDRFW